MLDSIRNPRSRRTIRRRIQEMPRIGAIRVFRLKSRTRNDGTEYKVTVDTRHGITHCSCPATKTCWHELRALAYIRNTSQAARYGSFQAVAAPAEPTRTRYVAIIDED